MKLCTKERGESWDTDVTTRRLLPLAALAGVALAACGGNGDFDGGLRVGVVRSAITEETSRIVAALQAGSDGQPGFLVKEVGGPLLENFNETLVYDPASSIKIVVAVRLLQAIESGASFDLDTIITHFTGIGIPNVPSCPTGDGPTESRTLGDLLSLMLVQSDNAATRTLIDFLETNPADPFAGVNATAQSIGMTSTNMSVYPGCQITNTMTQADAALLYEGIADGTLISSVSRDALFARMPANALDSAGTLAGAFAIVDEEAAAAGVSVAATDLFKSELRLHYKAGNDIWCDPNCLTYYSISGLVEIPRCSGETRISGPYAWGLFISAGSDENTTANTFFANQAEPLRRPIREALANWSSCAEPEPGACKTQTYEAENMFHSTGGSTPGGWNIWANGFISTDHDFTPGAARVIVRALGEPAQCVAPHMIVSVNGVAIGDVFVTNTTYADHVFNFVATAGTQQISIAFDNDLFNPPFEDRNLLVDSVTVDCGTPCSSFCANPESISWTGSYQGSTLGTGVICREATQPVVGGNCGNFATGRQLFVNGVEMPCNAGNWSSVPSAVNGGYCVQTTPGDFPWAFVTLW